jgi:hypothetical protein
MSAPPQIRSVRVVPAQATGSSTLTTVPEADAALRLGQTARTLARPRHRWQRDTPRNWARERGAGITQPSEADSCVT